MSDRTPRPLQPRRWSSLALAGATAGLTAASPGFGQFVPQAAQAITGAPVVLVDAQGGETGEATKTAQPQATAEGGEGGEAGATVGAPPDEAYLADVAIVEGHMRAAVLLYSKGQKDDAVALSYHPEAEMMDGVRAALVAHGAADFTPQMTALSQAMEAGADQAAVQAAFADLHAAIAAAAAVEAHQTKTRCAALVLLVKAAAAEYAGAIVDGKVEDGMAFHESWAFIQIARDQAADLAGLADAKVAKAAGKVVEGLKGADAAFGDITAKDLVPQDAGILLAVAGRVELAASQVR
jgi:dihydroxyacetone kinase DhaKLM complex PTS-EIIA-like component DhaM